MNIIDRIICRDRINSAEIYDLNLAETIFKLMT